MSIDFPLNQYFILERRSPVVYQNVVSYCKENNISISTFEKECDIGNGTIRRWKDDSSKPLLATLEKMQIATGIPVSDWIKSD